MQVQRLYSITPAARSELRCWNVSETHGILGRLCGFAAGCGLGLAVALVGTAGFGVGVVGGSPDDAAGALLCSWMETRGSTKDTQPQSEEESSLKWL